MISNLKKVDFEKVFPLLGVSEDGIAVSKKGAFTLGWEIKLPVMYTKSEDEYDDMIHAFDSALRILPTWCSVLRQDIYLKETWKPEDDDKKKGYFSQSFDEHFMGREYLTHKAYVYLTMASGGSMTKKSHKSGLFGINTNNIAPSRQDFDTFKVKAKEFETLLTSGNNISMYRLSYRDWVGTIEHPGLIHKYIFLGNNSGQLSDIELTNESIGSFGKKAMVFNVFSPEKLSPVASSVRKNQLLSTEGNPVYQSLGAAIGVSIDCEHIVNTTFVVPNQEAERARINEEQKKMKAGSEDEENALSASEIQKYKEMIINESPFTIKANINVIAWDNEDKYDELSGKLTSAFSMMGTTISSRAKYNAPLIWYACIPGNITEIGTDNLMTMELTSALCFNNWDTFQSNIPGGMLRICDRTRHVPITIDTQREAMKRGWIFDLNCFVLGPSGTGKSFFMNYLLRNCYDAGESIFIIDVGDSYEGLCNVIREESKGADGQYMSWDIKHPLEFNPFVGYGDWMDDRGNLKADSSSANFFVSVLQTIFSPAEGWNSSNEPILKQTISDFISKVVPEIEKTGRRPIFHDYYIFLRDTVQPSVYEHKYYVLGNVVKPEELNFGGLLKALSSYSKDGTYAFLLNSENPADLFTSRFIVFEVSRLSQIQDKKFYSLCILCIMHSFDRKMREKLEEFDVMVIEEAWKAISNETMAPYLRELWKTARKYSTSAIVVTQSMEDIIASDVVKDAILANSSTKILLDQSSAKKNFDPIANALSLSSNDRMSIFTMQCNKDPRYNYRDVFIKLGEGLSGVYSVEASPKELKAYDSRKDIKAPLLRRAEEIGYMAAIDEFVQKDQAEKQSVA